MAVLANILPLVFRSSALALELYRFSAAEPEAAKDLTRTAKSVNNLALIVKQVGTIIKEDDRLLSGEAVETLEDIVDQCTAILCEIESTVARHRNDVATRHDGQQHFDPSPPIGSAVVARLYYLVAHLDSLRSTLSVMLQTLYTTQSMIWARERPTISPKDVATVVAKEKHQLEALIIEQQMSILLATKLYEPARPDLRLLMDRDSSQSLVTTERGPPQPAHLFKYQDKSIVGIDAYSLSEDQWLPAVCGNSRTEVDRLLLQWSRLEKLLQELDEADSRERAHRRESQQPSVESDSEEDVEQQANAPPPCRPGSIQPLFTETATLPIPVPHKAPPPAPLSPASSYAVSPRSTGGNMPLSPSTSPASPRTSISSLPSEAAVALNAKENEEDTDLEIPWTLYSRRHYWKYIDGKVQETNTDAPSSEALSDRHGWTEILASWVCKEAIKEAGYHYTQLQKERRGGRRTKFETAFRIEKSLTYDQVRQLVERTVEIYRKRHAPSPPAQKHSRHGSFDKRIPDRDHDRTPLATKPQPPSLDRSHTALHIPQHLPPPLDRSASMPGPIPTYPAIPRASTQNLPPPQPTQYSPLASPRSPQLYFPPPPTHPHTPYSPCNPDPRHLQPSTHRTWPTHSSARSRQDNYSSTSESDGMERERERRRRTRSRSSRPEGRRKKGIEGRGTATALMGVAGLTALLDGLVGV